MSARVILAVIALIISVLVLAGVAIGDLEAVKVLAVGVLAAAVALLVP